VKRFDFPATVHRADRISYRLAGLPQHSTLSSPSDSIFERVSGGRMGSLRASFLVQHRRNALFQIRERFRFKKVDSLFERSSSRARRRRTNRIVFQWLTLSWRRNDTDGPLERATSIHNSTIERFSGQPLREQSGRDRCCLGVIGNLHRSSTHARRRVFSLIPPILQIVAVVHA